MRTIDADDLIERCERVIKYGIPSANGEHIIFVEWLMKIIKDMPTIEPELVWHECFDEDPNSFPNDDRMVLMSFSNFPTPAVGWFERDDEGGYWTDGGQKTLVEYGLFVDGWWELPKKPEGRE